MITVHNEAAQGPCKVNLVLMVLITLGVLAVAYNTYVALELLGDLFEAIGSLADVLLDMTLSYRPTEEELAQWEKEDDYQYI